MNPLCPPKGCGSHIGQYSALKQKYGPPPAEDQRWADKVTAEIRLIDYQNEPEKLAEKLRALRNQKEALEAQVKELTAPIEAHERLITAWLESANLTQFKTKDGDTVFIQDTPYCTVIDRDKWLAYIRESGQEALLSVHFQTMNSMVTDMLMRGEEPPPGISAFIKPKVRLRKGSK